MEPLFREKNESRMDDAGDTAAVLRGRRISRFDIRVCFLLFIMSMMIHMAAYTNYYLGHDMSVFCNIGIGWDIMTGRYMGGFAKVLTGFLQTPWLIGCISSLFMAFAVLGILKIFRIGRMVPALLIGLVSVTFPTYIAEHGYLYMLAQFAAAFIAAVWGVRFLDRRKGFIPAGLLFVLSLACYQAYIGISIGLILFMVILRTVRGEDTGKIVRYGLKGAATVIVSVALYYVIWQLLLRVTGLTAADYRDMNKPLGETIAAMALSVPSVYARVLKWYTGLLRSSYFLLACKWVILFLSVAGVVYAIRRVIKAPALSAGADRNASGSKHDRTVRVVLIAVSVLLLPFAMNISQFFNPGQAVSPMMECAYILPVWFVIIAAFPEKGKAVPVFPDLDIPEDGGKKKAAAVLFWIMCAAVIVNGIYGANASYLQLRQNSYRNDAELSQIIVRLSAEEDYTLSTPVVVIAEENPDINYVGFWWCRDTFGITDSCITYELSMYNQLQQMLPGIRLKSADPYLDNEAVKALSAWPDHNCLTWVDGTVVIKIRK